MVDLEDSPLYGDYPARLLSARVSKTTTIPRATRDHVSLYVSKPDREPSDNRALGR
jgi:hypothetical protein